MAVLQALATAARAVYRNPVLVGVTVLGALLQVPSAFSQVLGPLASMVVSLVVTL